MSSPSLAAFRLLGRAERLPVSPTSRLTSRLGLSPSTRNAFTHSNRRAFTSGPVRFADASSAHAKPSSSSSYSTGSVALKTARVCGYLIGSAAFGLFTVVGAIFIHDAFTYTSKHVDRVPVNPLALHPEVGGPKGLPIAKVLIGDEQVSLISEQIELFAVKLIC